MVCVCSTWLHKSVINIRRLILAASGTANHISSHYNSVPVVWKASSTIPSSSSEAARWNTENTFFQPDLMLWACECTICATQRTTMSRIVADLWLMPKNKNTLLIKTKHEKKTIHDRKIFSQNWRYGFTLATYRFFLTIYSKGRRKSFWKRKLGSSPFSKNFMASWRKESTQKNATSSLGLQPHWNRIKSRLDAVKSGLLSLLILLWRRLWLLEANSKLRHGLRILKSLA